MIVGPDRPVVALLGHHARIDRAVEREAKVGRDHRPDPSESDRCFGVDVGDAGRRYFMIRRSDLREARLDDVRLAMDCH